MAAEAQFRCDVAGPEALAALREAPLPPRLRGGAPTRSFHRDIYLDTTDRALLARGVSCRVRIQADDRRLLTLFLGGGPTAAVERYDAEVPELDPRQALDGTSDPARRLRGLVDPALLRPRIELELERWTRIAAAGALRRVPRFAFLYDACTVRHAGLTRSFEELQVRRLAPGPPHLEQVADSLEQQHGLRPLLTPRHVRAAQLVEALAAEGAARMLSSQTAVVLLALDEGRVAFLEHEGGDALEVGVARKIRENGDTGPTRLHWLPAGEAVAKVGTPDIRAPETLAALAVATRANLLELPSREPHQRPATARPLLVRTAPVAPHHVAPARAKNDLPPERFLNVELAQLAFQERVLEMGEDPGVPLAERLRFVAIVSNNLDELFAVRVGALKAALLAGSAARSFDGLTPREQLDVLAARLPPFLARQVECAEACLAAAAARGVRLRRWDELDDAARAALTAHFERELLPVLTPRAVTLSPGHPFPLIPQLVLTFGAIVRDVRTGPDHFASLPLKTRVDRLVAVPGSADFILVEEIVRANIQAFYPDREVEGAWLFRITRAAELDVNEDEAGDLLQAIEEEVQRRPGNTPVRVEIERGMPASVRETLLRELRFERRGVTASLGPEALYELEAPLDLSILRELAARLPPDESYPPFQPRRPLPAEPRLFDQIDRGDLLVQHPYDDFGATAARFIA